MAGTNSNAASIVRSEFGKLVPEDRKAEIESTPLAELGVDSLDFFEKLLILEDEFGIKISLSELDNDLTLQDILANLEVE